MPKRVIVVLKISSWSQRIGSDASLTPRWKRQALASHRRQMQIRETVLAALEKHGRPWIIEGPGTAFNAKGADLVVSIGGDGTLLSASHYVDKDTPLLGINNDPERSEGHFCVDLNPDKDLAAYFDQVLRNPATVPVTRMEVSVAGKVVADRVLNEALFSHTCPAAMTRLKFGKDRFACSGVWIGTGAGSTGALASAGGEEMQLDSRQLQAVVREPYKEASGEALRFVRRSIQFTSLTDDATLYFDGPFLRVPVGMDDLVRCAPSPDYLSLVV